MSVPFQGSRLANLRQKRPSQIENIIPAKQQQKGLILLEQQDTSYQPSISFQGGRTATRFLKGRIQRSGNTQKPTFSNVEPQSNYPNKQNNMERKPSLKLNQASTGEFKLILNDSPQFDKKKIQMKQPVQQAQQKRILIQKKQEKQQQKPQIKPKSEVKQQVKPVVKAPVNNIEQQVISAKNNSQQAIRQEEVQESKDGAQNQNELVECPEGCGRKFNRKALQKHAKACKLVFMSKRKQFNSEAKRFTSQEQATMVKQNKLQQKKAQMGISKGGKGFDKTSDNWKAASQDFRSAIKAIKKQGVQGEQGGQQDGNEKNLKTVACQYCQKPFAQALIGKHIQNCIKRKQKELKQKKKGTKKK